MSQILDQVETLRQQALSLLLEERANIEAKLTQLGFDGAALAEQKKTGRTVKCSRCNQEGHTVRTCTTPASVEQQ